MTTKSAGLIDLRSDTVTQPPDEMRKAMAAAVVGDDVYREDPTINDLEILAANIMGKESAVFVPSGSMGNLVSGLAWCPRGSEAIVGDNSHILLNEVGALADYGAVQMRPIPTNYKGMLTPDQVRKTNRPQEGFFPTTGMVEIYNTLNRAGGTAISRSEFEEVLDIYKGFNFSFSQFSVFI